MALTQRRCAHCSCKNVQGYRTYAMKDGEQRTMYHCSSCDRSFSETRNTPIAQLKTPISVIVHVLSALTEGVGINAALWGEQKQHLSVARAAQWPKKTLLLCALTHKFLQQLIEGDERYTRVHKKVSLDESQGWTVVLMDRATRFLWDRHGGRKNRKMFKKAMRLLCQVIEHTGDLTLLTDGERR